MFSRTKEKVKCSGCGGIVTHKHLFGNDTYSLDERVMYASIYKQWGNESNYAGFHLLLLHNKSKESKKFHLYVDDNPTYSEETIKGKSYILFRKCHDRVCYNVTQTNEDGEPNDISVIYTKKTPVLILDEKIFEDNDIDVFKISLGEGTYPHEILNKAHSTFESLKSESNMIPKKLIDLGNEII